LQHHSHQIIQAKSLRGFIHAALRGVRLLLGLIVTFAWLHLTLSTFPWTRPVALQLFPIFLSPLQQMGNALVRAIPDLIFLAILILIARYSLKLIRLYFTGLERGTITVQNFDPDWAVPTYNIVRLLVISFAAVIAYPYIPGSSSEAFKGVSLFLGVVFSLGSSSVISNLIAGYSLTYRRAFKTGDRIRLGEVYGDVVNSGLVVTRVRTPKNEDVVVPNSLILNSNVTNYSTMARQKALILHTTVGIGYGYPWRLVEAMLLQAADRTPGLLKEPGPFVRQLELGEFSIKYQINVYCDEAQKTLQLYSLLHQNILDVFNENGVQIMTPAYEGDPETPKVVPKEKLFVPLAGKTNGKSHKEK
jgi:small-conductance mechanosensitive channel